MKTLAFSLAFLLCLPAFADSPKPDAAKEQDIRKLLALTGADKMGVQVASQMLTMLSQQMPEEFVTEMRKELNPDELVNIVIPIYAKQFSHDEISQLIAMWQTPIAQKYVATAPALTQEAMKAGEEWGRKAAERAQRRVEQNKNKTQQNQNQPK